MNVEFSRGPKGLRYWILIMTTLTLLLDFVTGCSSLVNGNLSHTHKHKCQSVHKVRTAIRTSCVSSQLMQCLPWTESKHFIAKYWPQILFYKMRSDRISEYMRLLYPLQQSLGGGVYWNQVVPSVWLSTRCSHCSWCTAPIWIILSAQTPYIEWMWGGG